MDATATRPVRKTTAADAASTASAAPSFNAERKAAELQERVDTLEDLVQNMDSMANGAFDRINALVTLTRHYMTTPGRHIETIANALDEISHAAWEAQTYQEGEVRCAGFVPNAETRNREYMTLGA